MLRRIDPSINTKTTCLVSIKVFSSKDSVLMGNMGNYLNALKTASEINPKFVNISMEGESSSKAEYFYIYKMLKNGSIISVAAGNGHKDLSVNCDVFPACYKKIMPKKLSNRYNVVASPTTNSNFGGIINVYLDGKNKGIPLKSGSSQATAIMTASLVSE